MIKTLSCIKEQEDSSSITYSLKVRFNSIVDKEKRLRLVKTELEKDYQVKPDKLISIESFIDKKYFTYRYRVKIIKE